jgi:glycosyltransferase involved in cell wall biosynthesis
MLPSNKLSNSFVVVTPNFNMGSYLAETIESVLRNLRSGDEYYIIDGGSSDESVEIIEKYAHRLTGWVSEKDDSYADAISKGFMRGTGQFQCWINSGDLLLDGSIDLARELLDKSNTDMIFGDDFYIDGNSNVLGYSRGACRNLRLTMLYGAWTPLQDACFWRSDLYKRVEGLDKSLRNAADYDLFARFSVAGNVCYVPFAFSAFRKHDGQRSIAYTQSYQREKNDIRLKLVAESNDSALMKFFLRCYFFLAVRWRAYVMHRLWDRKNLHHKPIAKFEAKRYW